MESFGRTRRKLYICVRHNQGHLWLRMKLHDYFVPYGRNKIQNTKKQIHLHDLCTGFLSFSSVLRPDFPLHYVLETFLTDSQLTARTFKMSVDELRKPALNTVMKNLGVYNGLVGAVCFMPSFFSPDGREVAAVFFAFGLVVAIYGANFFSI